MKIGKLWGIPIKIHWTMLILLALYLVAGLGETVLVVLGAVLLHELGHAVAAGILGIKVSEVQLFPFGGQAKIEDFTAMHPLKEIGVALAGPAISLMLAGLFSWIFSGENHALGEAFVQVNWLLFGFNLLQIGRAHV